MKARISEENIDIIQKTFKKHFEPVDHLWIFGSRVDENKRGGDLDFYVEAHESASAAVKSKRAFICDLWHSLGDQKIDVVINLVSQSTFCLPIYNIAKKTGIQIV